MYKNILYKIFVNFEPLEYSHNFKRLKILKRKHVIFVRYDNTFEIFIIFFQFLDNFRIP